MFNRAFACGGIVNLITLLIGLGMGFMLGTWHSETNTAHAQSLADVEDVQPNITTGSAAFGTLLAHRIAVDELQVKGTDVLKLEENLLNYLHDQNPLVNSFAKLQAIVDGAKAKPILRMKPVEPPKPEQPKTGGEK